MVEGQFLIVCMQGIPSGYLEFDVLCFADFYLHWCYKSKKGIFGIFTVRLIHLFTVDAKMVLALGL